MRIAIFDLTDCEGCEVVLLSLHGEILTLSNNHQLVNFRFLSDHQEDGPFDLAFVGGMVCKEEEVEKVKFLRQQSKILVTIGTCAATGGINSILASRQEREKAKEKIYGWLYKLKATGVSAVTDYVKVDFVIRGCPPDKNQIRRYLLTLLKGKIPSTPKESVCFECPRGPFRSSQCLVTHAKKCLGAFTWAGCGGVCLENGLYCWGCWGIKKGINEKIIRETLSFLPKKEVKDLIKAFNKNILQADIGNDDRRLKCLPVNLEKLNQKRE